MADRATRPTAEPKGLLAREFCNLSLPLRVLRSGAGFYIGTYDESGPVSRESVEYWPDQAAAEKALSDGGDAWTQREHP